MCIPATNFIKTFISYFVIIIVVMGSSLLSAKDQNIVDEPIGAHYSLGLTLWHLGHNAERIREFHAFLETNGVDIASLLPRDKTILPTSINRILLDPELLPSDKLNGWKVDKKYIIGSVLDAGPTVSMPLHIPRDGLYRLWVRFYGWSDGTGITGIRIYPKGRENYAPLVSDEIYDSPVKHEGDCWKDLLVDLKAEDYVIKLSYVARRWQVKNLKGSFRYRSRRIDCIYLTDAIWKSAPHDNILATMRMGNIINNIQHTTAESMSRAEQDIWQRWSVRPVSWKDAASYPELFKFSRQFQNKIISDLVKQGYQDDALPDYRDPRRQVIFNDTWNMVANPVRCARQIKAIQNDIVTNGDDYVWYWLNPADFKSIKGWKIAGDGISGTYANFSGIAETDFSVNNSGPWYIWVRFRNIGYQATWSLTVTEPTGNSIRFNRDKQYYPEDIVGHATWQKVGAITIPKSVAEKKLHFNIRSGRYTPPATYRGIYKLFLTTNPNYIPKGTVAPPVTTTQYQARAAKLGATTGDGYLLDARGWAYDALSYEWWPETPVSDSDSIKLVMARNTTRAVQVRLRSVRNKPITLSVRCGPLISNRGQFKDKVSWRVVGFVPYGNTRQKWSPFCLLRRPYITIPPYSVAGLWLTVDTHDIPADNYTSDIMLTGDGVPDRSIRIAVQVSKIEPSPHKPVIVGGYTGPPEGEEYIKDYVNHHMRLGWVNWFISKQEMQKRDISLLMFRTQGEDGVRKTVERAKSLGLDYDDYCLKILDEPSGQTVEKLKPFLDMATIIRSVDSKVHICFNPGESARIKTFQILDPFCDLWLPYVNHLSYPPGEADATKNIFTVKPWLWYTTPCLWDKEPRMAMGLYSNIRSIPSQPGNCLGFAFFAFYYPFRDPWDTAYEYLPDASVVVLPSRNGPVPTISWEAIREAIQHADLARMVKERAVSSDETARALIINGSVSEILEWLEQKGIEHRDKCN